MDMEDLKRTVIVLNGPPRAGKDTAIHALQAAFPGIEVYQFFRPIKEMLHADLGLDVPYDHYESLKDVELPEFGNMTPRKAYIAKGDQLEAQFGPTVLTDIYFEALNRCTGSFLVTTCGKDSEAVKQAEIFGVDNMLVMRIHRAGKDFAGDSRSWVVSRHLNLCDVTNIPGQPRAYQAEVAAVAREFVQSRQLASAYAA